MTVTLAVPDSQPFVTWTSGTRFGKIQGVASHFLLWRGTDTECFSVCRLVLCSHKPCDRPQTGLKAYPAIPTHCNSHTSHNGNTAADLPILFPRPAIECHHWSSAVSRIRPSGHTNNEIRHTVFAITSCFSHGKFVQLILDLQMKPCRQGRSIRWSAPSRILGRISTMVSRQDRLGYRSNFTQNNCKPPLPIKPASTACRIGSAGRTSASAPSASSRWTQRPPRH